jgi:fumarylpyruvate hydrolase
MQYVIDPPAQATVAVTGTDKRFPVRRIFCVGRNYAEHALEMGDNPDRDPPFFFAKPADAVVDDSFEISFPVDTNNLHHEGELVVAIGKPGANIDPSRGLDHVWGYAAGIDLTRRDLQDVAKKMSRPWDLSKGFDNSAAVGPVHPTADVGHLASGEIRLSVNGKTRQLGNLADMIWPVPDIIAFLSRSVALAAGDLIMTGTPAGVSALVPGDTVLVDIEGIAPLTLKITDSA